MRYLILLFLLISPIHASTNRPKIYSYNAYKQANSAKLKQYAHDEQDIYWGIKDHDLALLTSKKLALTLDRDYHMKCTIAVSKSESDDSLENLIKEDYFFYWNGISQRESSPTEVVFRKNRALVSYYGTDGGGIWVTIKLIVKSKKQFDIYTIHSWSGDTAPVEAVKE